MSSLNRLFFLVWLIGCSLYSIANDRPNIIVILADDLGYSDIGCFGGEIETPNLDRLAQDGLRYSQFYNTSKCWTTRASLLTGEYWQKVTVGNGLKPETITVADRLKDAGYRTYLSGKWHLDQNRHDDPSRNPLEFGFDKFYGNLHGAVSYFNPYTLMRGKESAASEIEEDYYLTDAISEEAVKNVREHARDHDEDPFFLYLSYTAPHWPLHALPEDIEKYEAYYQGRSFSQLRRARFEKMRSLGVLSESAQLSDASHGDWTQVDQQWNARRMAVFAAMVDRMDQGIGQVLAALEDTGQLENTVICFMADNGASTELIGHGNALSCLGGEALTKDGRPISIAGEEMPGDETTFQGYGPDWANVSNTPYRYFKVTSFEGGIRSPFIVHWPAGIPKGRRGSIDHELLSHLIDLTPTFLQMAGQEIPNSIDGTSVLSYWQGKENGNPRRVLFNDFGKSSAMYDLPWKWVQYKGKRFLFNLEKDASETNDVSQQFPQRFHSMGQRFDEWKSSFDD